MQHAYSKQTGLFNRLLSASTNIFCVRAYIYVQNMTSSTLVKFQMHRLSHTKIPFASINPKVQSMKYVLKKKILRIVGIENPHFFELVILKYSFQKILHPSVFRFALNISYTFDFKYHLCLQIFKTQVKMVFLKGLN